MPSTGQPWVPTTPEEMPFSFTLLDPVRDRHLAFDDDTGRWHRLWPNRAPEPLTATDAIFLRPSDVDIIIKTSTIWAERQHGDSCGHELIDDLAAGVKQLVLHFANAANHPQAQRR